MTLSPHIKRVLFWLLMAILVVFILVVLLFGVGTTGGSPQLTR